MTSNNHGSAARELIAPNGSKRLVRRDAKGRFAESDQLGRPPSQDVPKHATSSPSPGRGDRGDRKH